MLEVMFISTDKNMSVKHIIFYKEISQDEIEKDLQRVSALVGMEVEAYQVKSLGTFGKSQELQ